MATKNILIGVVVLLVVIGGGYWLLKRQMGTTQPSNSTNSNSQTQGSQQVNPTLATNTQSPTSEPNKNSVIMEYSEQGFSQNSITVKSGTTVTWVNKSNDSMWVASNPHPIHTGLPAFDALKGIPTGGSYLYTFTKGGKWGYHNHLGPDKTGEVVVEQ